MKYKILLIFIFYSISIYSQHWQQFGTVNPGSCQSFYLDSSSNTLYASGEFLGTNNDTVYTPAYWDGQNWIVIGNYDFGIGGEPYRMLKYHDTLFVSGDFQRTNGAPGDYILRLNGNHWDSLMFSPNELVRALYIYHNWLYFGGYFTAFGPLSTDRIALFDGRFWAMVPPLLSIGKVEIMKEYMGQLIIAGYFDANLNPYYSGSIVAWDGLNFIPIDSGVSLSGDPPIAITEMEIYKDKLYLAGDFHADHIGSNIISWDGTQWDNAGGGTNLDVRSLQVYNNELYAAGHFFRAGNIPAAVIAKWDGSRWCSLGSIFDGFISDMCVYNGELIVSGTFTHIDGIPISYIAKWVGGNYTDTCQSLNGIDVIEDQIDIFLYPSPVLGKLIVSSKGFKMNGVKITDILGNIIFSELIGDTNISLDLQSYASGVYVLTVQTNNGVYVKKFIKE